MSDESEGLNEAEAGQETSGSGWHAGSFLTGLLVGAAVGAGVALLLAPASGEKTRRVLRRRAHSLRRDAAGGWVSAREEARRLLRQKKAALKDRIDQVADRLD
jgi:gas vesicle protein